MDNHYLFQSRKYLIDNDSHLIGVNNCNNKNAASPTPSQSWIEENIHSIISNKDDDTLNDSIGFQYKESDENETNKENNKFFLHNDFGSDIACEEEIERPRAFHDAPYQTMFKPNPLKRAASPIEPFQQVLNHGFPDWGQDYKYTNINLPFNQIDEEVVNYMSPPFSADKITFIQPFGVRGGANHMQQTSIGSAINYIQSQREHLEQEIQQQQQYIDSIKPFRPFNQYYQPQPQPQPQSQQKGYPNALKNIENITYQDHNNHKIFKSSSTLFKEHKMNQSFVTHSISSDNVCSLKSNFVPKCPEQAKSIKCLNQQQMPLNQYNFNENMKKQLQSPPSLQENCNMDHQKEHMVLHVRNLDYKISADEWRRILTENFKKHCKDVISVNIVTNADKSLLGIVKLGNKDDVRLAISSLHHKKIGYKRLNVAVAFTPTSNSPKSKVVALLRSTDTHEMALTRFMEMYELRYNQSITISELFKLRDVVHIAHCKDGQGRLIKLASKAQHNSLYNEMKDLMHTPYCVLHSHRYDFANKDFSSPNSPGACWLPNVIVSLRSFKPLVHKLLNDHGGQMPLLSFLDCYRACILNEPVTSSQNSKTHQSNNNSNNSGYQLIIDNDNGVPLEHLATCAQDVIISFNEGIFKQLQWENDKTKHNLPNRQPLSAHKNCLDSSSRIGECDYPMSEFDESLEESQRKQNQFSHEVVELFKSIPRCIIPLSKFNIEYHKKYGRQCRVADYGFTKLYDLLESIPHVLQILGSEYEKKLTLTHRVQVRRFSNDLIKVLKAHSSKQMFADEYPSAYEKHFGKAFDIKDYGVCFLEDMLAELPESTISRKEIDSRTFIQIPKIVQMEEEKLCTQRLTNDIIDMLRHKPRFSIQFNKFIPNFHHHFGRQLKLSNYGFTKLIELLEAIPNTVQVFVKDGLQFVQLKQDLMLDLICKNISNLIESSNYKIINMLLIDFEKMYNFTYDSICYEDFSCNDLADLFKILPFKKHFIEAQNVTIESGNDETTTTTSTITTNEYQMFSHISLKLEIVLERELKKIGKLALKKLMDDSDEVVLNLISQKQKLYFDELLQLLLSASDLDYISRLNKRSKNYLVKLLIEYFKIDYSCKSEQGEALIGFSDLYLYAKQIRHLYVRRNALELLMQDLEQIYRQTFRNTLQPAPTTSSTQTKQADNNNNNVQISMQHLTTICMSPKKLGFIDMNLLCTQGLKLLVTVKKHTDRRVYLNKEFWPQALIEANFNNNNNNNHNNSLNSPQSPIISEQFMGRQFQFITPVSHSSNTSTSSSSLTNTHRQSNLNSDKFQKLFVKEDI